MRRVLAIVLLALVGLVLTQFHPGSTVPGSVAVASAKSGGPLSVTPVHAIEDARHASNQFAYAPSTGSILPRAAQSNSVVRREVFGFAPYWNLSLYSEWNLNLISTVAYFGLDVNSNGTFATQGGGWDGWNSAYLTALINKAHLAGDRVVLVIKDFNDSSINYIVTTAAMQTLINQTIAAIASKNLDGVNVDFEGSGSPLFPDIPLGITNLMTAMSSQVHARWPQAEVSIDTYAGAASWDGGIFRIGDLAPVVDAMFVMAYDSVFSNMPGQAGPNSPMTHWTFNDTIDVAQYLTKAPASKIILGVPYYGYKWSTVDGSPYSSVVSGATAETYSDVIGDLTCGHIAFKQAWDTWGESPWASWWSPKTGDPCGANLGYPRELYYDDATSLGIKYDLVNSNNLRGAGMWTLGYDSGYPDLWNELAFKFTCSSLSVSVAPPSPSGVGTSVTVAAGAGCSNPLYQFWMLAPGTSSYQMVQAYSTSSTFTWHTAGLAPGTYRFSVWGRNADTSGAFGNALGRWDVYNNNTTYSLTTCSGLSVSVSPPSPSGVGATVKVSAGASGCPDPNPLYRFAILAPGSSSYQLAQAYSTSPSFTWNTTGLVPGSYRFSVWVKDANSGGAFGNSAGTWDAYNNNTVYTLSSLTTCSGLSVSVSPPSPSGVGATVMVSAVASGCLDPNPLYRFSILAPGSSSYQLAQAYSTSPSFTWNTTGLVPGSYRFSVWVKDANSGGAFGNSAGTWDAYNNNTVYILSSCSALSVTVSPASPASAGTAVTVRASASGCPDPNPLYQFLVLAPGSSTIQVVQAYSTSSTFTWNTTGLTTGQYRFSVWAKDANSGGASGNGVGRWDTYNNNTLYNLN